MSLLLAFAALIWWWHRSGESEREAISTLEKLDSLVAGNSLLFPDSIVVLPEIVRDKSPAEVSQWLRDVLREELSPEGIAELGDRGRFGKLADLFPADAAAWAKAAGVPPGDCLAFRMDREGVTAEVVLVPGPSGFRVSRCNNVKQMAPTTPQT